MLLTQRLIAILFFPHWWQLGSSGLQHAVAISKQKNQPMAVNTQVGCYLGFPLSKPRFRIATHSGHLKMEKINHTGWLLSCFFPRWWQLHGSRLHSGHLKMEKSIYSHPSVLHGSLNTINTQVNCYLFPIINGSWLLSCFPPSLMAVTWFWIANAVQNWHHPQPDKKRNKPAASVTDFGVHALMVHHLHLTSLSQK